MAKSPLSKENVCALTVNWNQADKTADCLRSVQQIDGGPCHVIVVDNGSTDNSREVLRREFSVPWLELIELKDNLGFAKAYNIGLKRAIDQGYELILLINNDVILRQDCLTQFLKAAATFVHDGLFTAKIYYLDTQKIWTVGGNFNRLTLEVTGSYRGQEDIGQFAESKQIEFAPLCGVLIRAALIRDVGFLDEDFFIYYEDMDYSWRIQQSQWQMRYIPEAIIWHAVSASSGGQDSPLERYWMGQGSGRYFRKHAALWQLWLLVIPYRFISAGKTTLRLAWRGDWASIIAYWLGLFRGWSTGRSITQPPKWLFPTKRKGSQK